MVGPLEEVAGGGALLRGDLSPPYITDAAEVIAEKMPHPLLVDDAAGGGDAGGGGVFGSAEGGGGCGGC